MEDLQPECSINVTDNPEFQQYKGKYVMVWFSYGYCGYCKSQVRNASQWANSMTQEEKDNIALVFINREQYASYYSGLTDPSYLESDHVHIP
eukprot:UN03809